MRNRLKFLIILLLITFFSCSNSMAGYNIKLRIRGIKDTICLVANYYANNTYVKDTLRVDGSGRMNFKAPDDLPKGMYVLVITDRQYFDFIINKDKKFSMETDITDLAGKMVIKDSPENTLFYNYLLTNREQYERVQALRNKEKSISSPKDSLEIEKQVKAISEEMIEYKLDIMKNHPGSFLALLFNLIREPEIPEIPVLANGRKDSTFAYRYYKSHFWDNVDFTDDRIIRTPVFYNKLKQYFDVVLVQSTDTIIKEADIFIEKTRPNPEMFKFMVWFLTYHYENSDVMGFDRIFVHLVENYYKTNQATWVNKTVLENIIKKSDRTKPLLIGMKAPNMIMLDSNNRPVSMYDINAKYLVLFFWDPDCGHCEQEIPRLKAFYDQNKEKYGLEIFAVCSDTSLVKWKNNVVNKKMNWINVDGPRTFTGNYHDQYDVVTTPVIYILNQQKEIIAKRLTVDQIEDFLRRYSATGIKP